MAEKRLFRSGEAAAICGASLVGDVGAAIDSVVVDSREAGAGSLFVALPGERADGHDFVAAALAAKAAAVLARADRAEKLRGLFDGATGPALIVVPDTVAALQALARAHRLRFPDLLRIGITGSSGKTTTKECLAAALGRDKKLVINPGNLNSDIGLPLALFAMGSEHDTGVFEMGMNRSGEIGELAWVYEPDIALITNVGSAHVGILGSRQAIAEEKKKIFSRFDGSQTAFVWEDDEFREFLKQDVRGEVLDFGFKSTAGLGSIVDLGLEGYEIDWEGLRFRFPLAGRHNLLDACAALALARRAGASPEGVAEGLSRVKPLFGRTEIFQGEFTLIRDCYNANPDSVAAAIDFCDGLDWLGRRAYVLGAMGELGSDSDELHRRIGARAAASKARALFFFGEAARPAFDAARDAGFGGALVFETDMDRLLSSVSAWMRPADLVLVKGSLATAMWRLTDRLPGIPKSQH